MIIHHVHNTYIQTLFALLAILTTSETFPVSQYHQLFSASKQHVFIGPVR